MRKISYFLILFFILVLCSFGFATTYFSDDFANGNYTSNPTWTPDGANWSVVSNYLQAANADTIYAYLDSNVVSKTNISFEFDTLFENATTDFVTMDMGVLYQYLTGNKYRLILYKGGDYKLQLRKSGSWSDLISSSGNTINNSTWYNVKAERDAAGLFTIYLDDVPKGTVTDTNLTNFSFVYVVAFGVTDKINYDNFLVSSTAAVNEITIVSPTATEYVTNNITVTFDLNSTQCSAWDVNITDNVNLTDSNSTLASNVNDTNSAQFSQAYNVQAVNGQHTIYVEAVCDANHLLTFSNSQDFNLAMADISANYNYSTEQVVSGNYTKTRVSLDDNSSFNAYTNNRTWSWLLNGTNFSSSQNTTLDLPYCGDFNVSLVVYGEEGGGTNDTNQLDQNISISCGYLNLHFIDENTSAAIQPTVTVNGSSKSPDANGLVSIDLNYTINRSYTIIALTPAKTSRTWIYDYNQFSAIDLNLLLLDTNKGLDIDFKFYYPDQITLLSNSYVEFLDNGTNKLASRIKTNSLGETTVFLNTDADYNLSIVSPSALTYSYYPTTVSVLPPRKESDLSEIAPILFDVEVGGLAQQSYTGNAATITFGIFSNTSDNYLITIDANDSSYYDRTYYLKTFGNPQTYSLQPYLVDSTDGISVKVITQSIIDFLPIGNVTIEIYKVVADEGKVLLETVVTDDKGEAFTSGIVNDNYDYEVYYNNNLVKNFDIKTTSTTLYIRFNPSSITALPANIFVNIGFFPIFSVITDLNTVFAQKLFLYNAEADSLRIWVKELDLNGNVPDANLYSTYITSGLVDGYSHSFDYSDIPSWDLNKNLRIYASVCITDSNCFTKRMTYYYSLGTSGELWQALTVDLKTDLGCTGEVCPFLILISFLVSIGVAGFLSVSLPFVDLDNHLGFVFIGIFGLFTLISWVHWALWFAAALLIIATSISSKEARK